MVSDAHWRVTGDNDVDSNTALGTTNGPLVMKTNGAEALRIEPTGKVGIGTTVPEAQLHVASESDNSPPHFQITNTGDRRGIARGAAWLRLHNTGQDPDTGEISAQGWDIMGGDNEMTFSVEGADPTMVLVGGIYPPRVGINTGLGVPEATLHAKLVVDPFSGAGDCVLGEAQGGTCPDEDGIAAGSTVGVHGVHHGRCGFGVRGDADDVGTAGFGNFGVYGKSSNVALFGELGFDSQGVAVLGRVQFTGNLFVGERQSPLGGTGEPPPPYDTVFRVDGNGKVFANGGFQVGGADIAECITVSDTPSPGDVVEIDPEHPGQFRLAATPQSIAVAGVISTHPGVTIGSEKMTASPYADEPQLALVGCVPIKVSAEAGPIRAGDLLVASSTPGHAMRASVHPSPGTVLGKALGNLESGTGLIKFLVMLR